ncbi:Aste57867_19244 [Aphanomyces stellatus]|uniref:Aste57867_19244 protein n=1 Tax=Aphanomyces stellatus TaxID=120398 RepID=A0A485LDT3_9STRA|nr:hypothetical protein As57867_019180 [Aphanomyces stellatus]VFT95964.1 Aste57867_19244 [Aphanomyces stellatus]
MGSYVVERHISHALYGGVWLCRYKGRQSAVKRCEIIAHSSSSLTCVEDMEYIRADIESEKSVNVELAKHRHKHILHMDDHFERDGFQHLVFEYCPNGDLLAEMKGLPDARFPQPRAIHYFRQVVAAVAHLHNNGFAHRDLSLENVLLDKHGNCKVCDFGLAVAVPSIQTDGPVGKLNYMAPEVHAEAAYDPCAADMWSLGMMLFIMITGVPLVHVPDESDKRFCILTQFGVLSLVNRWKMDGLFSEPVLELIERMLEVDPAKRIDIHALKKALSRLRRQVHPFEFRSTPQTRLGRFLRKWFL